jgi:hypothetical protein
MPLFLAMLCLALGSPTLVAPLLPDNQEESSRLVVHQKLEQQEENRQDQVDKWRRREILRIDGREKRGGNAIDQNLSPYVLLVVVPLLGFIILVALLRMGDF